MPPITLTFLAAAIAQPAAPAPVFVAHPTSSSAATGALKSLTPDGLVAIGDGATIPAGHLVSLRRADRPLPPWPRGPQVVLANGDRIAGEVTGGSDDALDFVPGGVRRATWPVPVPSLAAVWLTPPPPDTPLEPAAYPWNDAGKRRDAILLRNGDVVRGVIEGLTANPAAVRVKVANEPAPRVLPLARVAAFAFDPALARPRRVKGPYLRLATADGSRVSLRSATADTTTLRGTTPFGAAVEVLLADVIALDVLQGKATYLSDLKPKAATVEGFNGVAWPWVADRTVKGTNLRLGDQTYDKGLGTHPRTTLTYALTGKHRRFEALVGLDPATGRRGAAEVRVLLDGRPVPLPGLDRLTAGTSPRSVNVELGGAKELTLIVDYGPGGDVQDDVNWCDARLVE